MLRLNILSRIINAFSYHTKQSSPPVYDTVALLLGGCYEITHLLSLKVITFKISSISCAIVVVNYVSKIGYGVKKAV